MQILQILPQLKTNLNSVTGTVLHAILVFNIWESEFLFNPSAVAASNYPWNDREQNNSVDWSMPAKAVCFVKIRLNFCFFCQKVSFLLIKTVNIVIIIQISFCKCRCNFCFWLKTPESSKMDGAGANMCKAINIEGVAVKATYVSRVCVGGKTTNQSVLVSFTLKLNIMISLQRTNTSIIWMHDEA